MTGRARATALVATLVVLAGAAPLAAFKQARSAHGAPLYWPVKKVRVFVAGLPAPLDDTRGRQAVARAAAAWNGAGCGLSLELADAPEGALIVVTTPAGWTKNGSFAGHTEVISDDAHGQIERVVLELNGQLGWSDDDPIAEDALDLETVVLHELGHALGLGHSYDRRAVMAAGTRPGERQRALTDDDKRGLCAVAATPPR